MEPDNTTNEPQSYHVTFVGDYATCGVTVVDLAADPLEAEEAAVAAASEILASHYGIDVEGRGLASIDILVERM